MSSLFENTWSGHDFHLLPDLVLPFEGGIPDVPSPLSSIDAPQDWTVGLEDKHPAIRGRDVWMGSPEHGSQPLEHSSYLLPLPTLQPPTPPSACVSPHDIFAPVLDLEDEDAVDDYSPASPLLQDSSSSGHSFDVDMSLPDYTTTTISLAGLADSLLSATPSSPTSSLESSPRSQKRKRSSNDDDQPLAEEVSRTRRRSTASFTDESDEEESHEFVARARTKSAKRRSERIPCEDCEQDFGRRAELTRHKQTSCPGNKTSTAAKKYQCMKCGATLSRSDALVRHIDAGEGACNKYLKRSKA